MISYQCVQNMCDRNGELAAKEELAETRQWVNDQIEQRLAMTIEQLTTIIKSGDYPSITIGGETKSVREFVRSAIVDDFKAAGYTDRSKDTSVYDFSVYSVF